jgi:hypothetical protein
MNPLGVTKLFLHDCLYARIQVNGINDLQIFECEHKRLEGLANGTQGATMILAAMRGDEQYSTAFQVQARNTIVIETIPGCNRFQSVNYGVAGDEYAVGWNALAKQVETRELGRREVYIGKAARDAPVDFLRKRIPAIK